MNRKVYVVFNRNCLQKMKDFSRLDPLQAVTYTVKVEVVVSKKWCKIDTLLLHTTNKKYYMAYRFVPFPMTLKVLRLLQDSSNVFHEHLFDISHGFSETARRAVSRR